MTLAVPPLYDPLVEESGKANLNWTIFFQNAANGDAGEVWTPTFQNLGTSGAPIFTGRYYQLSKYIGYFTATIDPNGGNTTSTAGTTYIDNFPLPFTGDGIVFAVSGNLGDGPGHVVAASNRIYVPGWSAVSIPLKIIGIGEI